MCGVVPHRNGCNSTSFALQVNIGDLPFQILGGSEARGASYEDGQFGCNMSICEISV